MNDGRPKKLRLLRRYRELLRARWIRGVPSVRRFGNVRAMSRSRELCGRSDAHLEAVATTERTGVDALTDGPFGLGPLVD